MIKFPLCIVIYLTDYCNVKCKHCFLTQTGCLNKHNLDYKLLKKLLKIFKDNNVFMIAFTGGDSMLHPKIFDILNYTSELGMLPLLGISGNNISKDTAKKIYDSGVRCVQIGLNGSNAIINDSYRGLGNYNEILQTITILKDNNINVNLAFCIDKNNLSDVNNMLELAGILDIYKVKIEFWNCINDFDKDKVNEINEKEKSIVRSICDEYMKKNNKDNWIQYPKSSTSLSKIHSKALVIMANGDVKRNEMSNVLGNIYEDDFLEIMEGNND